MRTLRYRLADGSIVDTMEKAAESGIDYETFMEDVAEARPKMSPIREAMLKQFSYVSPKLINKVVL